MKQSLTNGTLACLCALMRRQGIQYQALPGQDRNPRLCRELMDFGFVFGATDCPKFMLHAVRHDCAERNR